MLIVVFCALLNKTTETTELPLLKRGDAARSWHVFGGASEGLAREISSHLSFFNHNITNSHRSSQTPVVNHAPISYTCSGLST